MTCPVARSDLNWTFRSESDDSPEGHEWDGCKEADARTRTGDPFITSEVLYQLSYVGEANTVAGCWAAFRSR
jgi:hypothetical protein